MNFNADSKSIELFKEKLSTLGLSESVYKILEVVFRQTIIESKTSGYTYDRDSKDKALFDKLLSNRERLHDISDYIKLCEKSSSCEYGFTLVHINEIDQHASLIHEYSAATKGLRDVFDKHSEAIDSEAANQFITELHDKIKDLLRINDRPTGRYFDESSFSLRVENFDYFSRYIGFNYGIYSPLFKSLVDKGDEKKNNFFRFLAAKLNFECENNSHIKIRFTAKILADRFRNNKKGYELLAEEPFKLGLINENFMEYLLENQHTIPKTGPNTRAS